MIPAWLKLATFANLCFSSFLALYLALGDIVFALFLVSDFSKFSSVLALPFLEGSKSFVLWIGIAWGIYSIALRFIFILRKMHGLENPGAKRLYQGTIAVSVLILIYFGLLFLIFSAAANGKIVPR